MSDEQRRALAELQFEAVLTQENVWSSSLVHVPDLHLQAQEMISDGLRRALHGTGSSPGGVVLNGRSGAGKTHLLGWVRQRLRNEGGYFFLSNLGESRDFWSNVVAAMLGGLAQDGADGLSQLGAFLRKLSTAANVLPSLTDALIGNAPLTPGGVDDFVGALWRLNRQVGQECQDAARALVLTASADSRERNIGYDYLTSSGELRPDDRRRWGFRSKPHEPRRVVGDVSKLLALTGPTVIAVDQIDTLVQLSNKKTAAIRTSADDDGVDVRIAAIADGLMLLRDETRRTLTIVACLPQSWELIRAKAVNSVPARFSVTPPLSRIPEVRVGRELVAARLAQTFDRIGFIPPHPTWPVAASAFDDVKEYTARDVIERIGKHAAACLNSGQVWELTSFATGAGQPTAVVDELPQLSSVDLETFDARFTQLKRDADVADVLHPDVEDRVMPGLLSAGLTAWVAERGTGQWSVDPPPTGRPAVHARLRLILDDELEEQAHWSFRAITSENGRSAAHWLNKACDAAEIRLGVPGRTLVLIRNTEWSHGSATQRYRAEVEKTGGASRVITDDDLRTFTALRRMLDDHQPGLNDWLAARRPAGGTELLGAVLPAVPEAAAEPSEEVGQRPRPSDVPMVPVGEFVADHSGAEVALESLRKHVVVFAGSGSGKTVLIRRLVEECALLGVSSIVLDPNNDLARLGDPWPTPPSGWHAGDEVKAEHYLGDTDVVIWTPGRVTGRPLAFPPLPDFDTVRGDRDEFAFAVRSAAASLAPRARIEGNSDRAAQGRAVLTQALEHYGKVGGRSLTGLINVLAELPEAVSDLANATAIAARLAEALRAARINDPLLRETADAVDPGALLTPTSPKLARVSVINLDGLPSLEEKQGFVNQLQMELFAWVKRNPASGRPLGGLLVMDEAQDLAPSTGRTPSTESSIRLASQARKYGLGLVLATQAPKAVHNRISGNATTQFFGRLNHPTHIEAAKELARNKGRDLPDLGRLPPGQFYVTGDNIGFQKVRAPLCLSHHPSSPLTSDEVLDRAKPHRDR